MARVETGQSESLFDEAEEAAASAAAPLAVRMRPRTLDEVVGQQHLPAPGSPLRQLVEGDAPMSLLLWGPPGTGKTTLAYVVSQVDQAALRRALRGHRRGQGRAGRDRRRPPRRWA